MAYELLRIINTGTLGLFLLAVSLISISMSQGYEPTTVKAFDFSSAVTTVCGILLFGWFAMDVAFYIMGVDSKLEKEAVASIRTSKITITVIYALLLAGMWTILTMASGGHVNASTELDAGSPAALAFTQVHRFNVIAGMFGSYASFQAASCYTQKRV